jgi:hypothetical protein
MAYIDPKVLEAAGFSDKVPPRSACVTANIAGIEGTGKTHWTLTAPKPLLYQSTDFGDDGVIQKADGQIVRPRSGDYRLEIPHEFRAFVDRAETDNERRVREGKLANFVHDQFYVPFEADYRAGIKAGVRTVVWDTAAEIWEYVRLSVYGRHATNRDDLKTEANSKMKEMIRHAGLHGVNLIMIQRLKHRWESYADPATGAIKWRQTADLELAGFDKAPELVALSLWTKFTPKVGEGEPSWELVVKKCRDNPAAVGLTLPALGFVDLMGVLVPSVSAEAWEA